MTEILNLEDLRYTLEKARNHIDTKWIQDEYFQFNLDDTETNAQQVIGLCLAGSVLYALDFTDDQWMDDSATVRYVIEALFENIPKGSAAYRHYRTEQSIHGPSCGCRKANDVIVEVLKRNRKIFTDPAQFQQAFNEIVESFYYDDGVCRVCHGIKRDAVIKWNDAARRTKQQVLDLVDATIKDTVRKMEVT